MTVGWNPWHGCRRLSPGCLHCYVYRIDGQHGKDSSLITMNRDIDLPLRKNRRGEWKIPSGKKVYTCFSSDFFLEEADAWRPRAWEAIFVRKDLSFLIITKRISRLASCLPEGWGAGWSNVTLCVTCEDQRRAEERLPIFLAAPIAHKRIICEPLLEKIDLRPWLTPAIEEVSAGGESGPDARVCRFSWVESLAVQCREAGIPFTFRQTGARLEKDGVIYRIPRAQQFLQAMKAGLNTKEQL
ncbi:MAG: DUF5131 family protein [Christensenellales bacterium]|jgi:protein gp37